MSMSNLKFQDDGRLKLLIIVGTRPEVIRLSEVIKKCRRHFDCLLAHTWARLSATSSPRVTSSWFGCSPTPF